MADNFEDEWTWKTPVTDEQLQQLRLEFWEHFRNAKYISPKACTCDGCPRERICVLSWDTYNTDGDCLYDK